MLIAEVNIYGKRGDTLWSQRKAVPNILEGLDYLDAIRSTVRSVYITRGGQMIDQKLHELESPPPLNLVRSAEDSE